MIALALAWLCGCGGKDSSSAESAKACAEQFVAAVNAGKMAEAAELYDYAGYGAANNENWDAIPTGQRNGIIGELKKNKPGHLQAKLAGATDLAAEPAESASNEAQFTLTAGGKALGPMVVTKTDGGWKIKSVLGVTASESGG